jgi:hypothetical protein
VRCYVLTSLNLASEVVRTQRTTHQHPAAELRVGSCWEPHHWELDVGCRMCFFDGSPMALANGEGPKGHPRFRIAARPPARRNRNKQQATSNPLSEPEPEPLSAHRSYTLHITQAVHTAYSTQAKHSAD